MREPRPVLLGLAWSRAEPAPLAPALYTDEAAFRLTLTARLSSGESNTWQGTTVVPKRLLSNAILMSGVAIPNRWIVVPLKSIEKAGQIFVRHNGVTYEATVRKKLKDLGYATLQIDRREKFARPFCDRENRIAGDSKDLTVIYLNESGEIEARVGLGIANKPNAAEQHHSIGVGWSRPARLREDRRHGHELLFQRRYHDDAVVPSWRRLGKGSWRESNIRLRHANELHIEAAGLRRSWEVSFSGDGRE